MFVALWSRDYEAVNDNLFDGWLHLYKGLKCKVLSAAVGRFPSYEMTRRRFHVIT